MAEQIEKKIGFIGAGNMAEALIKGMVKKGVATSANIYASDVVPERLDYMRDQTGINVFARNTDVLNNSDVLIFSVKPKNMDTVLEEIANETGEKLIISIVAGIDIDHIKKFLGANAPIVRVMPNTPALVGEAMSALVFNDTVGGADRSMARSIFESVGLVVEVTEKKINAITALSGSGPAYVFYMAEEMIRAGEAVGLDYDLSKELVIQTILGAGTMLSLSGEGPEDLRRKVTSPGGTTEAGLKIMEANKFSELILKTIKAAAKKANDLSKD